MTYWAKDMRLLYEDNDFLLTCSETDFNRWVIFCPSAAGLDRVTLKGVVKDASKKDAALDGIYTSLGINEINIIAKTAHWYQRPGILPCVEILKNILRGHEDQAVIYGHSMGGFGAIHLAGELGITSVAFSPQATLEANFDITENWNNVAEYAKYHYGTFKNNIIDGKCSKYPIYMFYDGSHVLDKKHASYIIKHYNNCISFNIPWGGHACSGSINCIYKIKRIIVEVLNHEFDPKKFRTDFFQKYNKAERRTYSAWSRFKYLYDIVHEHNFYIKLGMIRSKKYFDLCAGVCHTLEVNFPEYLEECLLCLEDDKKILRHIVNIGKAGELDILLENSYTRKKVLALFYQNRKQYAKSESIYRIIYELDKKSIDIVGNLAIVINKQGRKREALDILFRYIEINGKDEQSTAFLGRIYFEAKDYKNARRWLSLSFSYARFSGVKMNIGSHILYARSFKEEGKIIEAVDYLKQYLYIGQESGDYLAHLGAFSVMAGQSEEGLSFLEHAKKKKTYPNWTDTWIHKAHEKGK